MRPKSRGPDSAGQGRIVLWAFMTVALLRGMMNRASKQAEAQRLQQEGRFHELKRLCVKVLASEPQDLEFLALLAFASAVTGDLGKAEQSLRKAIALCPNEAVLHSNLGNVLKDRGRLPDAIASYEQALRLNPAHADAHYNLGLALTKAEKWTEGIESYKRAIANNSAFADAYYNLGNALRELGTVADAIEAYRHAIRYKPRLAEAHNNLGALLTRRGDYAAAAVQLRAAIALRSGWAEAQANLGLALQNSGDFGAAVASFRAALKADSSCRSALTGVITCARAMCEWQTLEDDVKSWKGNLEQATPFSLLGVADDPAELLRVSVAHARSFTVRPAPLWQGERYAHEKIRLAYLSADFHTHATSLLMTELFELHDRSAFEVFGISFGPDDKSGLRTRLSAAFDHFIDAREWSELEIARWLHEQEIEIAVDLKGYTRDARPGIFALRPVPVQVSYLGFPGTMGASFIDYLLADATIVPPDQTHFYTERVVFMPDSYQVNDRKRPIAPRTPSRAEEGLPEHSFVFCSFNNTWKITPEFFSCWMRLLHAVPRAVLWLLKDNAWAVENLRREAAALGISPERLVFAQRAPNPEHLARHRLADLFLDTLPCSAHTTASDALWAGLPVLTCEGRSFAGRVAASVLRAAGLPSLVTHSVAEYERMALELARDLASLAQLRSTLEANRATCPLFDTDRFRRNIEAAYRAMSHRYRAGEPPCELRVSG